MKNMAIILQTGPIPQPTPQEELFARLDAHVFKPAEWAGEQTNYAEVHKRLKYLWFVTEYLTENPYDTPALLPDRLEETKLAYPRVRPRVRSHTGPKDESNPFTGLSFDGMERRQFCSFIDSRYEGIIMALASDFATAFTLSAIYANSLGLDRCNLIDFGHSHPERVLVVDTPSGPLRFHPMKPYDGVMMEIDEPMSATGPQLAGGQYEVTGSTSSGIIQLGEPFIVQLKNDFQFAFTATRLRLIGPS